MFQKMDTTLDIPKIIEKINKVNSKYFKIIENNLETLSNPFLFKYGDDMYVFFEKINNKYTGIYCSKLLYKDGIFNYSEPILALTIEENLSYPFLIECNSEIYMMPEKKSDLDLFKCVHFPDEWVFVKTLLVGNFSGSTIFFHNNLYWLFTIETNQNSTEFKEQLYYSESLLDKKWIFHSTIKTTNKIGCRRGGGNLFMKDNKIYRPVHNNKNYYGESILLLEVTKLTTEEYEEKAVCVLNRNIHTFNMLDDWIVIDSNNGNKRFFEQDYERSVSRWNTKNNRKIMIDKYYKDIGEWLRYRESKNVLDIGINMFNIYNKSYFNNEEINYYQMDISVPIELKERLESTAIVDNFIELEKRYEEYIDHFDVIISYGVLGYIEFTPEEIGKYLLTASTLLKKDGKLYLKLDKKHMKKTFHKNNIVNEQQLLQYFKTDIIKEVISPDHILDDEHVFYVLNKK